jgi:tetratricopeptide (TPR) repeat protein
VLFLAVVPPALGCLYFSVTLAPTIGLGLGALVALVLMLVRGGRAAARVVVPLVLGLAVLISPVAWVGYRRLPPQQQARIQQVIHLQDPVAGERSLHWRVALDIFRDRPVIGNGYGSFRIYSLERMASEWYQQARGRATDMLVPGYAHNEYLQVLAGLGIIGGAILLVLLLLGYGLAVLVALRQPRDAWAYLAIGIAAASTAFLFQNFFGVTFRQTGVVTFFWLWLAILVVAAAWPMERELESSGPRLRELRFRPVPLASLTALTLVLGAALLALGWLAIRPVKSSLLLRRAQAAAAQGYFSDAVRIAEETLELNPYSAVAYYTLAYAHGQMGNIEQAVEANQKALTLLPGNASVYYNLGVSYKKLGRLEEAEEALRTAIELQPTGVENRGAMAEVLLEQKKFEEAEEHADEAVRLDPKNPKCYLLVADVAAKQGNLPKVLENLRLAARFAKDDPAVHQQLAELLLRLRQDKEAYGASLNWVKLAPHSARANAAVGTAAFNLGRYRQARSSFERALEIDPKDLKARLGLAYSAGRLRDQATAKRELERIVRTSPNSWEGREAKRVLDSVAANQARIRAR